jgi:hypothetical protein
MKDEPEVEAPPCSSFILPPSSFPSYCPSGSSGCFRSHSGRRLWTVGIASKLYDGGGDAVDHSSVQASHGSSPAGRPWRSDATTLYTKMAKPYLAETADDVVRGQDHHVAGDVGGEQPPSAWKPMTSTAPAVVLRTAGSSQPPRRRGSHDPIVTLSSSAYTRLRYLALYKWLMTISLSTGGQDCDS